LKFFSSKTSQVKIALISSPCLKTRKKQDTSTFGWNCSLRWVIHWRDSQMWEVVVGASSLLVSRNLSGTQSPTQGAWQRLVPLGHRGCRRNKIAWLVTTGLLMEIPS
jgi:hypothetical protein